MKHDQSTGEFVVVSMKVAETTTSNHHTQTHTKKSTRKKRKSVKNLKSHSSSVASSSSSTASSLHTVEYWPEFHQNYNSIMDNTNLVDSCAAALNDINGDDDDDEFSSLSSSNRNSIGFLDFDISTPLRLSSGSELSSGLGAKIVTPREIEIFTRWLCDIEKRMARQPTISQIFAMNSNEMAQQLKVHSKIFNDIVAQPCIVKSSIRPDYKSIEERYHLLYLKAYEVLLLLEGLPPVVDDSKRANSNKILNRAFYDFNSLTEEEIASDSENAVRSNSRFSQSTAANAKNFGTFCFKYEEQQKSKSPRKIRKNVSNESNQFDYQQRDSLSSSEANSLLIDKELTFSTFYDNELQSFLNGSDSSLNSYFSNERTVITHTHPNEHQHQHQQTLVDKECYSKINSYDIDYYFNDLIRPPALSPLEDHTELFEVSTENLQSKIQHWMAINDRRVLHKTQSVPDIRVNGFITKGKCSSLHSSILHRPYMKNSFNSLTDVDSTFDDFATDCLEWDNFQIEYEPQGQLSSDDQLNDVKIRQLAKKLCEFGNDYSLYLNTSSVYVEDDEECCNEHIAVDESDLLRNNNDSPIANKYICNDHKETVKTETNFQIQKPLSLRKKLPNYRHRLRQNAKYIRHKYTNSSSLTSTPILISNSSALSLASDSSVSSGSIKTSSKSSSSFTTFSFESLSNDKLQDANTAESSAPETPILSENKSAVFSEEISEPPPVQKNPTQFIPQQSSPDSKSSPLNANQSNIIICNTTETKSEIQSKETSQLIKRHISELKPEDFYDLIKIIQTNVDCVITVLGAESNRELTIHYCQKMKNERANVSNTVIDKDDVGSACRKRNSTKTLDNEPGVDHSDVLKIKKIDAVIGNLPNSNCHGGGEETACMCSRIAESVTMIFDFVFDIFNIVRNMKLYIYLCKVVKELFGAPRAVAQQLKIKRELINSRAIAY